MEANPNTIELGTQLTTAHGNGGIIDFHYQGSTSNYTSRIMEIEKVLSRMMEVSILLDILNHLEVFGYLVVVSL